MSFVPSVEQNNFFNWVVNSTGNCILEAVAGAGKTTTILHAISKMRGKVWFGVYNKKMADEIKDKINNFPELKNRPFPHEALETSTFHSLGFGIIRFFNGKSVQTVVDENKVVNIVNQVIARKEAEDQIEREDLRQIASAVVSVVSMAKNRGFVFPSKAGYISNTLYDINNTSHWVDMINQFDFSDTIPESTDMNEFIRFCQHVLTVNNKTTTTIDMDDMVYLPVALNMKTGYRSYNWVLIDEAQDTNPSRRALAYKVMTKGGRLVAVGDPHQAIFGFTGADNDSLEQIKKTSKAISLPLNVTYRCPKKIVAHARSWVSHITAHESAPDGILRSIQYDCLVSEIKTVNKEEYSNIAILCRYNSYLVKLCFKMIREGISARIEGRSIGEGLVKLATRWKSIKNINVLEDRLMIYMEREMRKFNAQSREDKAERIKDQVETLLAIISRARSQNLSHIHELKDMISDMFTDNVSNKGLITLCSVHKSKGLEWKHVYLLGREEFMPSKMANQDWQIAQEHNLIYVALTRAKHELIEVNDVKE